MPAPIFLLASERSGSNLLRILLNNHSQVHAPVAPHFFDAFVPLAWHYGDLRVRENMLRLLDDMLGYVQHPFHAWGLRADAAGLRARFAPTTLFGACDALWRAIAEQHGKATFMSKDNHLFNYAFEIKACWPQAKLLYLYRDPRDQCASWVATPFHLKTVEDIARRWEREQRRCMLLRDAHGFDLCSVSYEELIADTPAVMRRVLEHCGLSVEEACFQTDPAKVPEAGRTKLWANLDKPVMRDNARKYAKVLSKGQVLQVETVAAPMMRRLGYPFDTAADWKPGPLRSLAYRMEWRRMDRKARALKDEELRLLVEKQRFLEALKRRLAAGGAN